MEITKRGFELLKTRPLKDQADIESLEAKYKLNLPPYYKLFAQLFYLSLGDGPVAELRYRPENNPTRDEIFFDVLFPLEFSMSTFRENEFWYEKGYMQIGGGPPDGGILVTIEGDFPDAIIYNNGHTYTKIANTVFDFFRDVVVEKK